MTEVTIRWTMQATDSVAELLSYIGAQPYGDSLARAREIYKSVWLLRDHPEIGPVSHIRYQKQYRKLVVEDRFHVYYIYYPPNDRRKGIVSIRAVRHAALKNPFAGVRETPRYGYSPTLRNYAHL